MIVAIHQPHYMPWLGYFDKMGRADVFVFLDTVQFKKNEFQNRNKVKGPNGAIWLTVPIYQHFGQKISGVTINNTVNWRQKHIKTLYTNYRKSPHFDRYFNIFEDFLSKPWEKLSDLNIACVKMIASLLGIEVQYLIASELGITSDNRDMRLIEIIKKVGGGRYIAGSGGKEYMNLALYKKEEIAVEFQDFAHPRYPQLFDDFVPGLSSIDYLCNVGERFYTG